MSSATVPPSHQKVTASNLVRGSLYFMVSFVDPEMMIPILETLIFEGRNDLGDFKFRNAISVFLGESDEAAAAAARIVFCEESELAGLEDLEGAVKILTACADQRRRKAGV